MTEVTDREHRLALSAHPYAVSCARDHVRRVLAAWHREDLLDTAELVVSELVTNAVKATLRFAGTADAGGHDADRGREDGRVPVPRGEGGTRSPFPGGKDDRGPVPDGDGRHGDVSGADAVWVDLHVRDGAVVLEVGDRAEGTPVRTTPEPGAESGRGLLLVDLLCADWGCRWLLRGGKVVWCVIDE